MSVQEYWQISLFWWYESLGSDVRKSKCALYGKSTVKKNTKCNMELYDYCFSAFHGLTEWSSIDSIGTDSVFFLYILLIQTVCLKYILTQKYFKVSATS